MYERARPGYPAEAVAWIVEELGLARGAHVVDLAAGTGKLTRQLVELGFHVTAVEPVRGMREVLARVLPDVEALEGTAEAIPVGDSVAAAVAVAQAFHWFDLELALPELHRVLAPGGGVALIWNLRDESDPLHQAYAEAIRPYRGGHYPDFGPFTFADALADSELFERFERREFRLVQLLDADGLVDRARSVSFVAALPENERATLLERIRALAPAGTFEFPYVTRVFTAHRAQSSA